MTTDSRSAEDAVRLDEAAPVEDQPREDAEGGRPAAARSTGPLWLLAALVPTLALVLYGSSGRDDAYITYWEADQLRRTGTLGNYNGRALEQSSSLLQTLALAALGWITHVPIPTLGALFTLTAAALCAPAAFWLAGKLEPRGQWAAAALVATLPPLVYWSAGGLETTIAALCVLVAIAAILAVVESPSGSVFLASLATLAALLVRPETGLVLTVALAIATPVIRFVVPTGWSSRKGLARNTVALRALVATVATAGGVLAIGMARKAYTGDFFPRPVAVKTGRPDVHMGFSYLVDSLSRSFVWIALAVGLVLIVAMCLRTLTPGWILAGAVFGTGLTAEVMAGGDFMECARLMVPWLTVGMVLVGAALGRLPPRLCIAGLGILIAVSVAGLVNYAARYSTGTSAWGHIVWQREASSVVTDPAHARPGWFERRNAVHQRDLPFIEAADRVLAATQRVVGSRKLSYASPQAGMTVYYLQERATRRGSPFHFIDINGLSDDTWDRCRENLKSKQIGTPVPLGRMLRGECGPLPDVLSDISVAFRKPVNGYEELYRQSGLINSSAWPRGSGVDGGQWIAVRKDLVGRVRAQLGI